MVKMILALPKHVDCDKFADLVGTVLRGRYGENGYYGGGLWLDFRPLIYPQTTTRIYTAGFSGKGGLHYYEKDAEELDPVIIATIDSLLQFIEGAGFCFVADKKILPHDWWKPYRNFGNEPSVDSVDDVRDEYDRILTLINDTGEIGNTFQA